MNIRRIAINNVTEIIEIEVVHSDYKGQVAKRINEKMPLATVKGFRKGAVPKAIVEKHYGKAIKEEEINKLIKLELERYITSERLRLLGSPLKIEKEIDNWDNEVLSFQYEIGLVPQFELNLEANPNITKYIIKADDEILDRQISHIQKQFGNTNPIESVTSNSEIRGTFATADKTIYNVTTITLDLFKEVNTSDLFLGKKTGDSIVLNTKNLFKDDHLLMDHLRISHEEVHDLAIDVTFTIENINEIIPAELNQELFDKLFGEGKIATIDDLKIKIKEDIEIQLESQAKNKLEEDVINSLIENTKFDLPETFLKRWLQTAGEKKLSEQEAAAEYYKSEKALRYQMIEVNALSQNEIKVNFEDLKAFTAKFIRQQMAQMGHGNPSEEEINEIIPKILSNQDEVRRLSEQTSKEKLIELFVEKSNPTPKEVSYKEFVAAIYGE